MSEQSRRGARDFSPLRLCIPAPLLVLAIVALAINTVACQAAPTFTPTPTPRLTTVEGGIAEIRFDERVIVLDQRAAPLYTLKLSEDTEIVGSDQKPNAPQHT